jgi:hypothetical protein
MDSIEQRAEARKLAARIFAESGKGDATKLDYVRAATRDFPAVGAGYLEVFWREAAGLDPRSGTPLAR